MHASPEIPPGPGSASANARPAAAWVVSLALVLGAASAAGTAGPAGAAGPADPDGAAGPARETIEADARAPEAAATRPPEALIVGGVHDVTTVPGDSLTRIAARFGLPVPVLARLNDLPPDAWLALDQVLRVEVAHVVPRALDALPDDAILVNVPQRMLFERRGGALVAAYPIAAGRPTWRTPLGEFEIDEREVDKPWIVPRSIQEEMRRAGEPVLTIVPPGPDNPLGRHWLGLAPSSCGLHATNAPTSIYSLRTHGCIRLHPDDAAALFERSRLGDRVWIVYEPVLLAALPDGRVCLEVNPDAYRDAEPASASVDRLIAQADVGERIDPERVAAVVAGRQGLAYDVTRGGSGGLCTPPPATP